MNTKKIILFAALVLLVAALVASDPLTFGLCRNIEVYNEVMRRCISGALLPEYILQLSGFISLSFLVLSLITYKMRDEVFHAWWGFARWWVPVIIGVTLFLENAGGGGGLGISGAVSGAFDALVLGILYTILVITSLFRIIRAYSQSKGTW
jgi:hypothetical protein